MLNKFRVESIVDGALVTARFLERYVHAHVNGGADDADAVGRLPDALLEAIMLAQKIPELRQ